MNVDLTPKLAKQVYGGDGGSYHAWCPDEHPMLKEGNIGAAKLALSKNGFALPRYSDSAKVAYVLQGCGVAGIVLPEKEEKVIAIKRGDAIALPFGVVTWWYNKEDTELVVLFLGDTKTAHKAGSFTDMYLTSSNGIFTGFSTEFVSRAWNVEESVAKTLVSSQTAKGIVKLDAAFQMPEPKQGHRDGMVLNCEEAPLDVDIKDGGKVVVLNTKNLPLVGEVGLGADLVRLNGSAMCSPGFSCDSALQVTYIVRGSGRVQVVGVDGKRVLETHIKAGNLFIVPRFFVVSKIGDPDGMEWFSIITTPNPMFTHLAGTTSVWKALSPQVMQAAFKVSPDVEKQFSTKRTAESGGITQVLTIINKQHQPWLDGQELLDDALQNKRFLPTGCRSIDTFLHGGLKEGYLTELVGTSSSGKTQISLQAASAVAKSWGKVVFLDSGNSFSPKRVAQIITETSDLSAYEVDKSLQQVMNNIVCLSVFDIFTLFEVLHQLKNNLRSQIDQHIRMLIIDSVSSLITPILGGGGAHGHALMVSVGFLLKRLAHEHDISILVTNHMVAGERGTSKPALGESWRSIPHVRLLLSRDHIRNISSMSVLRHPHMATGDKVEFELQ